MIPYLAPVSFYRARTAAETPPVLPFNRARLAPDLLLTVPVAGGSGALRRFASREPERLVISQHGRWQHVHLGALEARLGRTPFWRHLEPLVVPLIADASGPLFSLNEALGKIMDKFLDLPTLLPELREFALRDPERLAAIASGLLRDLTAFSPGIPYEDLPLLVPAALFGRNAIFILGTPLL